MPSFVTAAVIWLVAAVILAGGVVLSHNGLMFWSIKLIWGIADLGKRPALPSSVTVWRAGRYPVGPKHALNQAACAEIVLAAVPVATVPVEVVGVTLAQPAKSMAHEVPAIFFRFLRIQGSNLLFI